MPRKRWNHYGFTPARIQPIIVSHPVSVVYNLARRRLAQTLVSNLPHMISPMEFTHVCHSDRPSRPFLPTYSSPQCFPYNPCSRSFQSSDTGPSAAAVSSSPLASASTPARPPALQVPPRRLPILDHYSLSLFAVVVLDHSLHPHCRHTTVVHSILNRDRCIAYTPPS